MIKTHKKVEIKQGFTVYLENVFPGKPQPGGGGDSNWPPRVKVTHIIVIL